MIGAIGAGGMGEVFRSRDTRLDMERARQAAAVVFAALAASFLSARRALFVDPTNTLREE